MKNRFNKYRKSTQDPSAIKTKEQVKNNPDKHITQDFPGFPGAPATKELITPITKEQKRTAAVNVQDGEKMNNPKKEVDEQYSDGSGGAFSSTEELIDDEEY